ncbi:MAG TPA: ATP phosphoribosyltransferase regulatory subunit [Candidatus Dormibacteraeota bacterium]|nr:ATP phosphoribosyltransferase regulatory subunit [Candidatus Dormibacteraeota bacterium]
MRLPAGTRDWLPGEFAAKRSLEAALRGVFVRFGYQEAATPGFERVDVIEAGLGKALAEESFRFSDRRGTNLALRPEMTTPIARLVSTRLRGAPMPLRLCYVAPVYRYEEPQEGRMREFTQAGVELIGNASVEADVEIMLSALEALDAAGLPDARIDVNHVAIVEAVLREVGLSPDEEHQVKGLLGRRNLVALRAFCARHGGPKVQVLPELALLRGGVEVLDRLLRHVPHPRVDGGIARLRAILSRAESLSMGHRISIDFALLRDFEYYTGLVFEAYVPELGFSLLGGGRYDGLLGNFGFPAPAVGWTSGVERLLIALERRGGLPAAAAAPAEYLVAAGDDRLARSLREHGARVARSLDGADEGELLAQAQAHGIPCVVAGGICIQVADGSRRPIADVLGGEVPA